MKKVLGIVILIVLAGIALAVFTTQTAKAPTTDQNPSPTATSTAPIGDENISITNPAPNTKILSPVTIAGSALGTYYFEASFPVEVLDQSGAVIGQGHAVAQGDWMTEAQVPFTATVTFTSPNSGTGVLRFKNDNPSDLPATEKHFDLPISF